MTIAEHPDRQFQLWEYKVSHGSALIRSPRGPSASTNVDIVVVGVEYLSLPTLLRGVIVEEGTAKEQAQMSGLLGRMLADEGVWALVSSQVRYLVVGVQLDVRENTMDIFESPFESL